MATPIYLVDAFVDRPFSGNPAGVCLLPALNDAEWMQAVANEMQQAETAFLAPNGPDFDLRWFTPEAEVDLCGHATLASAKVLFDLDTGRTELRFHTRSGVLTATRVGDEIELDFPAGVPTEKALPHAISGLSTPLWTGITPMDWLVEVESEAEVRAFRPDFAEVAGLGLRGLIVTARSEEFDFISRGFFPQVGIPEDPVTGSAHCALAAYWAPKLGKTEMVGYQASRRGGVVRVTLVEDRVKLRGRARVFLRGELGSD